MAIINVLGLRVWWVDLQFEIENPDNVYLPRSMIDLSVVWGTCQLTQNSSLNFLSLTMMISLDLRADVNGGIASFYHINYSNL